MELLHQVALVVLADLAAAVVEVVLLVQSAAQEYFTFSTKNNYDTMEIL